ncbi:hypothetical protein [Kitasatospora sp. NBC_01539]|uniref:hypothetical protein n=1 Tax=Kitasatospora sp. NBC_01539 TaxID=2903577 RepID=UPI0038600AD0
MVMFGASSCSWDQEETGPEHFPGAFPGSHSDAGSEQAFRGFGISAPEPMTDLGYYAKSKDDAYPMAAVFATKTGRGG